MASIKRSALAVNATVDLTALSTEAFINYRRAESPDSSVKRQATSAKRQAASDKHQAKDSSSKQQASSSEQQAASDKPRASSSSI
jgi:hypothetical protein